MEVLLVFLLSPWQRWILNIDLLPFICNSAFGEWSLSGRTSSLECTFLADLFRVSLSCLLRMLLRILVLLNFGLLLVIVFNISSPTVSRSTLSGLCVESDSPMLVLLGRFMTNGCMMLLSLNSMAVWSTIIKQALGSLNLDCCLVYWGKLGGLGRQLRFNRRPWHACHIGLAREMLMSWGY